MTNADLLIFQVLNERKRPPIYTSMTDATPAEQDTFGIPKEDRDIFKRRRNPAFDRRVPDLWGIGNARKVIARGDEVPQKLRDSGHTNLTTDNKDGAPVKISKGDSRNPFVGLADKTSPWFNAPFNPLPKSRKRQAHRDALIALGHHVRAQSLSPERGFAGWDKLHDMADNDNKAFQEGQAFGEIDPKLHSEYGRLINMEVDRMIDHHNRKHTQRSRPGLTPTSGFNWKGTSGNRHGTLGGKTVYSSTGKEDDHDAIDHSSVGAMPSVHGEIQSNLGWSVRAELRSGDRDSAIIDKHDEEIRGMLHNQLHLLFMGMDHTGKDGSKDLKINNSHFSPAMKQIPDLDGALQMSKKVRGL